MRFYQEKFDNKKDYYKVLGLTPSASEADIKKAYRNLVIKHHPDRKGGSETKIKEINEAKEVLLDSDTKKQYDEARRYGSSYGAQNQSTSAGTYGKSYSSSYGNQYNKQRNTRFYENADWGPDPFAEFFKQAHKQRAQRAQQQYTGSQSRSKYKKFYIYRDKYGNEYVVEEEGPGSQGYDPRQEQREYYQSYQAYKNAHKDQRTYGAQNGMDNESMDRMFREFAEGFRNPGGIFDDIFKEQREKAKREEGFRRSQMNRDTYNDINFKETKLNQDLQKYGKRVREAWDIFRYSAEDKGITGGLKDAFSYLIKGDKKK